MILYACMIHSHSKNLNAPKTHASWANPFSMHNKHFYWQMPIAMKLGEAQVRSGLGQRVNENF